MRKFVSGLIVGLVGVGVCAVVCFAVVNIGFKGGESSDVGDSDVVHEDLASVKKRMESTVAIYVCQHSDELNKVCNGDDLIKEIRDVGVVGRFLDVALGLEESTDDAHDAILDAYTLYLVDEGGGVVVSVDYSAHFMIKLSNWRYYMSTERNEEIDKILGIEVFLYTDGKK